jgi:hypothetical protein
MTDYAWKAAQIHTQSLYKLDRYLYMKWAGSIILEKANSSTVLGG